MQAIVTGYRNTGASGRGTMVASCSARSKRMAYDHSLSTDNNHREAAMQLVAANGWHGYGEWVVGGLPNSDDRVWVCIGKHSMPQDSFRVD